MKQINSILVVGSLFFVLIMNLLANALPFNGLLTQNISDSYVVKFVPAGYVFAIWGVIYLGLIAFAFYYLRNNTKPELAKLVIPYTVANVLNGLWLLAWHYQQLSLSVGIMIALLVTLIIYYLLQVRNDLGFSYKWSVKIPAGIYLGWISVATIANLTSWLWINNFGLFSLSDSVWAGILILIAGLLASLMIKAHKDFAYALVIIWAVTGIAVKFPTDQVVFVAAFGAVIIIVLEGILKITRIFK